jgi:hypothetical protein
MAINFHIKMGLDAIKNCMILDKFRLRTAFLKNLTVVERRKQEQLSVAQYWITGPQCNEGLTGSNLVIA